MPDPMLGFRAKQELKDLLQAEAKMAGLSLARYLALIVANRPSAGSAAPPDAITDMSEVWHRLASGIGKFAANPGDAGTVNALSAAADRVTKHLKSENQLVPAVKIKAYQAAIDALADDLLGASLEAALAEYELPPSEFEILRTQWRNGIAAALAEHIGEV